MLIPLRTACVQSVQQPRGTQAIRLQEFIDRAGLSEHFGVFVSVDLLKQLTRSPPARTSSFILPLVILKPFKFWSCSLDEV